VSAWIFCTRRYALTVERHVMSMRIPALFIPLPFYSTKTTFPSVTVKIAKHFTHSEHFYRGAKIYTLRIVKLFYMYIRHAFHEISSLYVLSYIFFFLPFLRICAYTCVCDSDRCSPISMKIIQHSFRNKVAYINTITASKIP